MVEVRGWTSPDAWILASITTSRRGSTLSRVIGTADAFNHGIPSRDQLASSFGALIDAGLVDVTDGRFRLTRNGKRIRKTWRGGAFEWGQVLPRLEPIPRSSREYPLTSEEWQRAYDEYYPPERRSR
ncbi:hypothetical protein FB382_001311 [Nocardioides ginsengisegetis]|uniref:Uncharacterized protein n=1 Tax=Nocardioides ginsengisegetis TaxID=661491 RepID=A0A7W3IYK3_9ACTN|nr:hypothetical protein [Nocardioides ginsengisegetis]MBA8803020.1 hypothetical protein [Nocardioides ginsengisegetis]